MAAFVPEVKWLALCAQKYPDAHHSCPIHPDFSGCSKASLKNLSSQCLIRKGDSVVVQGKVRERLRVLAILVFSLLSLMSKEIPWDHTSIDQLLRSRYLLWVKLALPTSVSSHPLLFFCSPTFQFWMQPNKGKTKVKAFCILYFAIPLNAL